MRCDKQTSSNNLREHLLYEHAKCIAQSDPLFQGSLGIRTSVSSVIDVRPNLYATLDLQKHSLSTRTVWSGVGGWCKVLTRLPPWQWMFFPPELWIQRDESISGSRIAVLVLHGCQITWKVCFLITGRKLCVIVLLCWHNGLGVRISLHQTFPV